MARLIYSLLTSLDLLEVRRFGSGVAALRYTLRR